MGEERARSRRWTAHAALFVAVLGLPLGTFGEAPPPVPPPPAAGEVQPVAEGVPVVLEGQILFPVRAPYGPITVEKRAAAISARVELMAGDPFLDERELVTEESQYGIAILYRGDLIMAVTEEDAKAEGRPLPEVAKSYRRSILSAALAYQEVRSDKFLGRHIAYAGLATLALVVLLVVLLKFLKWLESYEERKYRAHLERLQLQKEVTLIRWAFRGARWGLSAFLLYLYAGIVFQMFPLTRGWAAAIGSYTLHPLRTIGAGLLRSLPDLLFIALAVLLTRAALKAIKTLFVQAAGGHVSLPGVQPYWAMSAYKIVRLALIALAAVVIYPYIPGSQSLAFKGLTLFAGALVTFGSSSIVGNLFNGLILMGVNPFDVGDRIRIGDTEGDVTKVTFFTTQIRTIKNVEVTIPNTQATQSPILNYSAQARGPGLILHTTVTIGYDAPWRKVHENLLEAARRTEHILSDPAPFILQTALNDFYVSYQLNAYTREANLQANIYGKLHQNIQDTFNEAGMEIMSPHFAALRDGNTIAIPERYRPEGYEVPRFGVDSKGPDGPGRD